MTDYDVIIVGAGMCGLSAAMELHRLDPALRVLVLEGRNRTGGRAHSYVYPEPPAAGGRVFEAGAQYIGHNQTAIWKLIETLGLSEQIVDGYCRRRGSREQVMVLDGKRHLYDRDRCLFDIGGLPPELEPWDTLAILLLLAEFEVVEREINVAAPWLSPDHVTELDHMTMEQWLARPWVPKAARDAMRISVQAVLSVEPSEVSALFFLWYVVCNRGLIQTINDEYGGAQQYFLNCGISGLVDRMVQRLRLNPNFELKLQAHVTKVEPSGKTTEVTWQDRSGKQPFPETTLTSQTAILTGPLGSLLRKIDIPRVEPKRQALGNVKMGRTIKCQVFYDERWWDDSHGNRYTGWCGATGEKDVRDRTVNWIMDVSAEHGDNEIYALMTFSVGAAADAMAGKSDAEIKAAVLDGIRFLMNDSAASRPSGFHVKRWTPGKPDYTSGGPNPVFPPGILVDGSADPPAAYLNRPLHERIFFAAGESCRKLRPDRPAWAGVDEAGDTIYPDWRQSMGYLDGAIVGGRFVAHQAASVMPGVDWWSGVRDAPPGGPHASKDAAELPDPREKMELRKARVLLEKFIYWLSSETSTARKYVARWTQTGWYSDAPQMAPWLVNGLGMQMFFLPGIKPTLKQMKAFVWAGIEVGSDPSATPDQVEDMRHLTQLLRQLITTRSALPFNPQRRARTQDECRDFSPEALADNPPARDYVPRPRYGSTIQGLRDLE